MPVAVNAGKTRAMNDTGDIRRPRIMRIDQSRCQHGGLCELLAPEVGDGHDVPVTPYTLAAMAECPTGALRWSEDELEGA